MSVDTLNADLATLRVPPGLAAPGCECRRCEERAAALARVEAELSRLTRALEVAEEDHNIAERHNLKRAEAAEARCARLQQAGLAISEWDAAQPTPAIPARLMTALDVALAGPDTPADTGENLAAQVQEAKRLLDEGDKAGVLAYLLDRDPDEIRALLPADRTAAPESRATSTQSEGSPEGDDGGTGAAATPADSPPPRREYGGYMGGEPWGAPADSQEDKA